MKVVPHPEMNDPIQRALIQCIEAGLPLTARPYAAIGERIGISENEVIRRIRELYEGDLIKRMGVVVRHRRLGYKANAMVVWDIADDEVEEMGRCFGAFPFVTLCYQRPRRLPQWRYNLFTMIHGRDRDEVVVRIDSMANHCGLENRSYDILFSKHCYKQRGARYGALSKAAVPAG